MPVSVCFKTITRHEKGYLYSIYFLFHPFLFWAFSTPLQRKNVFLAKSAPSNSQLFRKILSCFEYFLGRIQDLVKGGSDKLLPTLSNCYCCLTSPFFTRKSMVKIFAFVSLKGVRPNHPWIRPRLPFSFEVLTKTSPQSLKLR